MDSTEIEKTIEIEDWTKARKIIRTELKRDSKNHWLITRLGLTYYEQKQYKRALTYSKKAYAIAPKCPLVLWDYAGALEMLGRVQEAIEIYQRLIQKGVKRIAYGTCGEGLAWARGLVSDCYYRLAHCYKHQKENKKAVDAIKKHLSLRGPGCRSIYTIKEARYKLKAIRKASNTATSYF
jgi:tetratricopeptide (TPR) repeat protein